MQQKQRTRKHFQISPQRHQKELIDCLIKNQSNILHDIQTRFSGYQANQYFDYKSPMTQFLDIQVNNIGDPFSSGTFNINTKQIEIAVLDYYAALFRVTPRNNELDPNAPDKIQNPQAYWGYVLSMGSSEGNLMAFWTARDYIAGKYLIINKLTETKQEVTHTIKKQSPIKIKNYKKNIKEYYCKISKKSIKHHQGDLLQSVYFCSSATHYSVIKSAVIMGVQSFNQVGNQIYAQAQISYKNNNGETIYLKKSGQPFPQFVPVYNDFDGRIDPQKLTALVNFFASKRHGIIIFLNYGTTFTGAFDEIELISQKLEPIFEKYGLNEITREIPDPIQAGKTFQDTRRGYWIHVDGALGNGYLIQNQLGINIKKFQYKQVRLFDIQHNITIILLQYNICIFSGFLSI